MRQFDMRSTVACLVLLLSGCDSVVVTGGNWTPGTSMPTRPVGSVATTRVPLSADVTNACEEAWAVRLLSYHPGPVVPRQMYFASCTSPEGATRLWTSMTTATPGSDVTAGLLVEAELDPATGALTPTGVERSFSECVEMHGVAARSDCSLVAALCRRPSRSSETEPFTRDLVAELPDTGDGGARWWLTQPGSEESGQINDEEWLYEWPTGDVRVQPSMYVVDKAIGGWVYGSQYLVYGERDDSYGISLKATVFGGGVWHEGDTFLIVDRESFSIAPDRGWTWGCAPGHTLFNHPTFNPASGEYAVTCGTDIGVDESVSGAFGGIWMHTERGATQGYLSVPIHNSITIGGGPTSLLPLDDGGYLGVFVGVDGTFGSNHDFQSTGPVTSIGIARFAADGTTVGEPTAVASAPGMFLSYPQLAPLGDGAYLLGWGEMVALSEQDDWNLLRVPATYHLVEIDVDGNALTEVMTLAGGGWGEQDEMVSLGRGRVGWAYTPDPARDGRALPPCASTELALHVYTRAP
jgi:hypothetical protein